MRCYRLLLGLLALSTTPLLAQDLTQPYLSDRLIVRFAPGAAADDRALLRGALASTGFRSLDLVPGLEVVQIGLDVPQALAVLANNPNVLYAEPDYVLQPVEVPSDYYFYLQWGHENTGQDIRGVAGNVGADIDMPAAWDVVPSSRTTVAIIDTGTQWDHEDLAANIWVNEDEVPDGVDNDGNGYVDDLRGWDFFGGDNDPSDGNGHGTHTAGTVGAVRGNGIGIAGVCGSCSIMPLRFIGPAGGSTADAISAIGYAVANGATVSNNSYGGGAFSQGFYDAVEAAGNAGHVFVAAAGNNGLNADNFPSYPASYDLPNVISVAATDNRDTLAGFSNYGSTSVDIGAPGVDVASTYWDPQTAEDDYWWNSGTSMAAPHVAGVVALLQEQNPQLSSAAIVDRVLRSARPVQSFAGLLATGGMLNAYNAVMGIFPEPPPVPAGPPETPDDLTAEDSTHGSALLAWTSVADATYYIIEREERRRNGHRTGGTWFQISAGPGTSQSYEDLTGAKEYLYYRIAAGNSLGTSVMSAWVPVTVTDTSDTGDAGSGGPPQCHPKKGC